MYEDQMALFAKVPGGFELYLAFEEAVCSRYPAEVRAKKTQVGFFDGCGFAWVWSPRGRSKSIPDARLGVSIGLPERIFSPRIIEAVEPWPGRWTHHLFLKDASEMDEEFFSWLDAAHAFALSRSRRKKKD